jgi:hypothetical protein
MMISSFVKPLSSISAGSSPQPPQRSMNLAHPNVATPHVVREKKPTDVLMDGSNDRPDVRTVAVLGYN